MWQAGRSETDCGWTADCSRYGSIGGWRVVLHAPYGTCAAVGASQRQQFFVLCSLSLYKTCKMKVLPVAQLFLLAITRREVTWAFSNNHNNNRNIIEFCRGGSTFSLQEYGNECEAVKSEILGSAFQQVCVCVCVYCVYLCVSCFYAF